MDAFLFNVGANASVLDWAARDTGPNLFPVYQGEKDGSQPCLPPRLILGDSPYGNTYGCMFFQDGLVAKSYYALQDNPAYEIGNGSATFEGWAKIKAANVATSMSIYAGGPSGSNRWFGPLTTASKLRAVFFGCGIADLDISSATSVPADAWFKWSVTLNRAAGKVYVHLNGIKEAEAVLSGTFTDFSSIRTIAYNFANGADLPFSGRIAGVRVSNIARYTAANYVPEHIPFVADSSTVALVQGSPIVSTAEV